MRSGSAHDFERQQRTLRQETLVKLREARLNVCDSCHRFDSDCRKFDVFLNTTPRQVVYRYHRTREAILARADRIAELLGFLTHGGSGGRIEWGGRLLDRTAMATKVIGGLNTKRRSETSGVSGNAMRMEAVRMLAERHAELKQWLASHDAARNALTDAAGSILQCAKKLCRQGVLSAQDPAVEFLEGLLLYLFWDDAGDRNGRWPARAARAESALKTRPLRDVCNQALDGVTRSVTAGTTRAVERKKRGLLHAAAGQLVARLEAWRAGPRFSAAERAILALQFTFTSARQGLGGLGVYQLGQHERVLDESTDKETFYAVRSLMQQGVLEESDLGVFRYTPAVWQAVERYQKKATVTMREIDRAMP